MDTLTAFARGQAAQGNRARVFDWDKAAAIIVNGGVQSAAAGLEDDWEYTGGDILRDGQPVPADDTYTYLASTWAMPQLLIHGEACVPCWTWEDETDWDSHTYWPDSALAILRGGEPKAIEPGNA